MFGRCHGFRVCTGARYLRGYIGYDESKHDWLRESTLMWEKNINMISKTVKQFSQESYAAVVREIQSEWIFLQHITWYMGYAFTGVEKMIRETILPCLFFGKTKTLSPVVGSLSTMPVKKARLGLLNPLTSYQEKYLSSTGGRVELVRAVMGGKAFSNADHL